MIRHTDRDAIVDVIAAASHCRYAALCRHDSEDIARLAVYYAIFSLFDATSFRLRLSCRHICAFAC